jgi:hypothetical protein
MGVARIFGFNFSGFLAWWMWRTIYLSKLPGYDLETTPHARARVVCRRTLSDEKREGVWNLPLEKSRNIRHGRNIPSLVCCACCDCCGFAQS